MRKKVIIFPFSGSGIEALDCLDEDYECIAFISDEIKHIGKDFFGIPIFDRQKLTEFEKVHLLAVPGSAHSYLRKSEVIALVSNPLFEWATIIHPKASISKYAIIGKNVVIMAGVSIGPNVIIEDHVIILPNSTIHHDSTICKYSIICGNVLVAGNVKIEENCYIGAGSSLKNGIQIGTKSLIGIGSVVTKNVPSNEIWFGNSAKKQ